MGAITDLWKSERGLVAIALIAAATVGLATARIPPDQWIDYTKWIFVTYAAAKTVTGSVAMLKSVPDTAAGPPAAGVASPGPQIVKPLATRVPLTSDADHPPAA